MEKKEWENRSLTTEEIDHKIEELEKQILAWELWVKYEDKLNDFREIYLEWYEGRFTLKEILQAMMDGSICHSINPFEREER